MDEKSLDQLGSALAPYFKTLGDKMQESKASFGWVDMDALKKSLAQLKPEPIDFSKIPPAEVTVNVPEVKVPDIHVPEVKVPPINIPEIVIPPINVPRPSVTVNVDQVGVKNWPKPLDLKNVEELLRKIEEKKWLHTSTVSGVAQGLSIPVHDYESYDTSGSTTDVITFYTGGSTGTAVARITFVYTDSSKDTVSTITKV